MYVAGNTHAGVVVPPPPLSQLLERARGKFRRFLSACIHSADCRGVRVNEVWCVQTSLARRLESTKSLLYRAHVEMVH